MTAKYKTLHLIPDTNVFMQCRLLKELPWSVVFSEYDAVVIVLVSPVIREIDRLKGGQGRLAKRARNTNSLIGQLIDASEVHLSGEGDTPQVTLVAMSQVKPNPSLASELDYTHPDDAIVGIVSALPMEHGWQEVALLSNDNGPLMSARRTGVPFYRVPSEWLLPAESDEDQKRLRTLEGEISRLKSAEPICVIKPHGERWEFDLNRFEPLTEEQVQSLLSELRNRFPITTDFGSKVKIDRRPGSPLSGIYALYGREEFIPASDEEITLYQNEHYPAWLLSCEKYLRDLHHQLDNAQELPKIQIDLINEGTRPADAVRVLFSLHGSGLLLKLPDDDESESLESNSDVSNELTIGSKKIKFPRPPSPPVGKWKKLGLLSAIGDAQRLTAMMDHYQPLSRSLFQPSPRETDAFYWKKDARPTYPKQWTELTCEQWRHRAEPERFEFEIISSLNENNCVGSLHVEIHASNLTDPVKKVIPIKIMNTPGNTLEQAIEVIEFLDYIKNK